MAKKRKRNSKANKVQRNNKSEDFIVNSKAYCKVTVPDFSSLIRRKKGHGSQYYVNNSCISQQVSLPLILVSNGGEKVKEYQIKGSRRKAIAAQVPFVPSSCITYSTTPVIHFCKKKDNKKKLPKSRKSNSTVFVPKSCITGKVSLPYICQAVDKQLCTYPAPIALSKNYDIVLEQGARRYRRKYIGTFVPGSCITFSTTPVYYKSINEPRPLVNPYPALPDLAPDIITSSAKRIRSKTNASAAFVPTSCIIDDIVEALDESVLKQLAPLVKYEYIERPNSPDIHGPVVRKTRKRSGNIVAFVPKSCTIEEKRVPEPFVNKGDVLARTNPDTVPTDVPKINRLALAMFVIILVSFVYYLSRAN